MNHFDIWPLTIVLTKAGDWLAFDRYPSDIPEEINTSVSAHYNWIDENSPEGVGVGSTPEEATRDLKEQIGLRGTA